VLRVCSWSGSSRSLSSNL